MNYLTYMTKRMYISQNYEGKRSHHNASHGIPVSYPIDECGEDGISSFYCPCNKMNVIRKYYVNDDKRTSIVVFQSADKVQTPTFNDYINIACVHIDDLTIKKMKPSYVRGEVMFDEGKDGATGYHCHIEIAKGKYKGMQYNTKRTAYILKSAIKPETAFYIDPNFTTKIEKDGGLKWITLPKQERITYIVLKGDTLSKIAKKYNTSWKKIYDDNKKAIDEEAKKHDIKKNYYNHIYAGTKLTI